MVSRTADEAIVQGKAVAAIPAAQRKALTSYLGKEGLPMIDRNLTPIRLIAGDRVLLMSDGVFGTLNEDQMISCIVGSAQETADAMIRAVERAKKTAQDNATCVVFACRTSNE